MRIKLVKKIELYIIINISTMPSNRNRTRKNKNKNKKTTKLSSPPPFLYKDYSNAGYDTDGTWNPHREEKIKQKQLLAEKYSVVRSKNWTGLRTQPDNDIEGRNWMTFFCLKRLNKYFSGIKVMKLINEYLNWVPAGCWNHPKTLTIGCTECGILFIDHDRLGTQVCSWQCYERYLRGIIEKDFDLFIANAKNVENDLDKYNNIESIEFEVNCYAPCFDNIFYEHQYDIIEWYVDRETFRRSAEESHRYGSSIYYYDSS